MKQFGIIFTFIFFFVTSEAQNLVPNPSFEDTLPSPNWNAVIQGACKFWFGDLPASTDYHNNLNPLCSGCASLLQIPRTGDAYAGIYTFGAQPSQYREDLCVQLLDTLRAGKKYCVDFFVSRNEELNYACNNIGVYFSSSQIGNSSNIISPMHIPQVSNDISTSNLFDSNGWTKVSGSFIAAGGEKFLTIANFADDANSDTTYLGGGVSNQKIAYYFIDDVSVYECDDTSTSSLFIPNIFTPNGDGMNDEFQVQAAGMKTYSCQIFNRWGVEVFSTTDVNKFWDGRTTDGNECSDGTYYYIISAAGEDGKDYSRKGFLTLMR